jgi:putative ABC transport system permease protein
MNAIYSKIKADLRRRKLQSFVIALVIFLSSGAATLALNLLVETDAPYDHAFAQVNGAHLTMAFDASKVTEAQLRKTASAPGVTQSAGPWPATPAEMTWQSGKGDTTTFGFNVVGRDRPDTAVDRLTMVDGRWATAPGEIVLSQNLADELHTVVGNTLTTTPDAGNISLRIVGIASSINSGTGGWVQAGQIAALKPPKAGLEYQMLYRVSPASSSDDLQRAANGIAALLPAGAVNQVDNYLAAKIDADRTTAVMIPFLLAFSGFALLAAAFIICNIVAGVVIAEYREIGVMKSVGFAPGQVVSVLMAQILIPVVVGCLLGLPAGMLLSQPFLANTAHAFGLPTYGAVFATTAVPVIASVLTCVLAVASLAALYPAWRAGRMSAVAAITKGSAPSAGKTSALSRMLLSLPLPRPVSLGLGDAFARPVRAIFTLGAILIGVSTVVFALGLHESLGMVAEGIFRDQSVQVIVHRGPQGSDAQITTLLQADPRTARFVSMGETDASVPGIADPVTFYGYKGDSSWLGYPIIDGRWFSASNEVVAPTHLLRLANLKVGDTFTALVNGKPTTLHVVGSILDQTNDNLLLRGSWQTLATGDPGARSQEFDVQLKDGTDQQAYADSLTAQGGPSGSFRGGAFYASPTQDASRSVPFILIGSVVAGLALVLAAIAVAGVFNTALLNTREGVRDIAILKSVGMSPRGVVSMVVASVALLGLLAGALGIPVGLALHHLILQSMARIASDTELPTSFYDSIDHALLPVLALSGMLVAVIGAWLPARWAAYSGVVEVLQSE